MDVTDIVLINQLLAHYGHLVDAAAWDRFDELFLDDAELDYRAVNVPEVLHGLAAIQAFFATANHPSAHYCTNVYVYTEDGTVRVKSKFVAPYTRATHDPHRWYGGDYDDVVERTRAGWRFRSRTCSARWHFTADAGPIPEHRRTW
ncbi:MAG TPA: nuclear transport factor 2 family protein [Jatrophihabitans sp.]|nr:nuclear transport factor 2 family protein [Jatrophihabitans sp.]